MALIGLGKPEYLLEISLDYGEMFPCGKFILNLSSLDTARLENKIDVLESLLFAKKTFEKRWIITDKGFLTRIDSEKTTLLEKRASIDIGTLNGLLALKLLRREMAMDYNRSPLHMHILPGSKIKNILKVGGLFYLDN